MSASSSAIVCLIVVMCLFVRISTSDEMYCVQCKALMEDCRKLFGRNFSSVSESSLLTTTSSLCGKYYIGFEEVICRILCQVNSSDLLKALQEDVSIHTICQKGGVCNENSINKVA